MKTKLFRPVVLMLLGLLAAVFGGSKVGTVDIDALALRLGDPERPCSRTWLN